MVKISEQDKIYGLSLGVDDFIVKFFSFCELVLCVYNILCCFYCGGEIEVVSFGNLWMNYGSYEV